MQIPYTFARREFMLWPTGLSGYVPVSSQEMEMFEIQLSEVTSTPFVPCYYIRTPILYYGTEGV